MPEIKSRILSHAEELAAVQVLVSSRVTHTSGDQRCIAEDFQSQ